MDISLEFKTIVCAECGCPFCMLREHWAIAARDKKTIYCPSGHEIFCTLPADARSRKDRRELISALHRAEQAEAKAAEKTGK